MSGQEARGTFTGEHGKLQMESSALQVSPEPMAPPLPLPAQMGPQRPQVTERECTPRQRLMPFKQTQSEKDRESQYLSEQAKQAGSPRNVREGEASAQRTLFQQTDIWRPSLSWGWGRGWSSNSVPTGKWMGPGPGGQRLAEELTHHFPGLGTRKGVWSKIHSFNCPASSNL